VAGFKIWLSTASKRETNRGFGATSARGRRDKPAQSACRVRIRRANPHIRKSPQTQGYARRGSRVIRGVKRLTLGESGGWWSMILSTCLRPPKHLVHTMGSCQGLRAGGKPCPSRIKSGTGVFGIMLYMPARTTRLILSAVNFCPPIESVGGLVLRSTLSTVPVTSVAIATLCPAESFAEIDIV
jgi:hypothetical protein